MNKQCPTRCGAPPKAKPKPMAETIITILMSAIVAALIFLMFCSCATTQPSREAQEMAWFINYLNTAADDTNQ